MSPTRNKGKPIRETAINAILSVLLLALCVVSCSSPELQPSPTPTGTISGVTSGIVEKLSLEELTTHADLIIVGTVTAIKSRWNEEHSLIVTDVSVSIETTVKGSAVTDPVTVRVPGGQMDEIIQLVTDVPSLALGEKALLFLQSQEVDTMSVVGGFQGKYTVEGEEIAGSEMSLQEFISEIERIIRGDSETKVPYETVLE